MDQSVRRRQNHSLISFPKTGVRTAYKPYAYIDGIKQNPVPLKRPRRKQAPGTFRFHPLGSLFKNSGKPGKRKAGATVEETWSPEGIQSPAPIAAPKQLSPVVITAPKKPFWDSPAPVCVLVGIAVFSALILGLQDTPVMALSPGEDPGITLRVNLAAYAGTAIPGIDGIIPEAGVQGIPAPETETAPIPLDLMETFQWESYRVARGDSVSKIAADHSVSMDAIIASNGIANARRLRVGQELRIPNMDGIPYTVKRGDTISKISTAMGAPMDAILDANDLDTDTLSAGQSLFIPGAKMAKEDLKLALGELFIYPIRGRLTSPFGWRNDPISGVRRYHAALDLAAPTGTTIKAAMDGRIATVGYNATYGNYIIITHSKGFQTLYGHLSAVSVKQGAYVYQGGKIGAVGSTGYSTGPHLHFAVYKNGKAVNPLEFLNP
jgi:murein DD-endopeptidase MepM/ murein hydrolase activator NlpD